MAIGRRMTTSLLLFGAVLGCSSSSGPTEIAKGPTGPTPSGPSAPGGPSDISPQPQPAPGELPNVNLDRLTVRSAGLAEIELVGAPRATNAPEVLVANLDRNDTIRRIAVGEDRSLRATMPGRLGDRLLVLPRDGQLTGIPSHVIAAERATLADDCVKPASLLDSLYLVASDAKQVTINVENGCRDTIAIVSHAIDAQIETKPFELDPREVTGVDLDMKAPLGGPMVIALRDATGKARVGAFFLPAPPE